MLPLRDLYNIHSPFFFHFIYKSSQLNFLAGSIMLNRNKTPPRCHRDARSVVSAAVDWPEDDHQDGDGSWPKDDQTKIRGPSHEKLLMSPGERLMPARSLLSIVHMPRTLPGFQRPSFSITDHYSIPANRFFSTLTNVIGILRSLDGAPLSSTGTEPGRYCPHLAGCPPYHLGVDETEDLMIRGSFEESLNKNLHHIKYLHTAPYRNSHHLFASQLFALIARHLFASQFFVKHSAYQRLMQNYNSVDDKFWRIFEHIYLLAFPADIGRKPASPARRSRQRFHAGEDRLCRQRLHAV